MASNEELLAAQATRLEAKNADLRVCLTDAEESLEAFFRAENAQTWRVSYQHVRDALERLKRGSE